MSDEFEDRLKSLTPRAAGIDPVAAAYRAGMTVGRASSYRWRTAAAVLAVAAVLPWTVRSSQKQSATPQEIADRPAETRVQPGLSPMRSEADVCDALLDRGLAALPPVPPVVRLRSVDEMN